MVGETVGEDVGQLLAEEGNVWLHDTSLRDVVVLIIVIGRSTATLLLLAVLGPLALLRLESRLNVLVALLATRDYVVEDVFVDGLAWDLPAAVLARGGCEGAVALNNLLWENAGCRLNVVYILSVVAEKLALSLEKLNEGVGGCELLG